MTTPPSSYDWVREIKPNLKKLDSVPLTGTAPPFPWDDLAARLARSFDREGLVIQPGEMAWRAKEDLYEGLGDSPFPLIFSIPSLRGQVGWIMPAQEMSSLAALLLTKESHPLPLHDAALDESFYHFLALEVLYHFTQVAFDKTLSPILTNQRILPNEDALCWDISLLIHNHTIWGRLMISPEFRRSWIEHFAQKYESSSLSQQMAHLVNVIVHLEAGKTQFSLAEWKSVELGDFIILDSCSLDPERLDGRILLTINGKQTFRAKLKEGTLKILELPLLHEVETSMAKQPEEEEDDLSDLDLPEEENEELDEEDLFDDEDDLFEDEEDEDEEDEDEDEDEDEEDKDEEADTGVSTPVMEPDSEVSSPTQAAAPEQEAKPRLIAAEQIPVTLVVEVGQVQMTMDQLLKLEPGNLLEISIHPENGVDLTINGKVVGKGELVRIGEVIGVRVLELGR